MKYAITVGLMSLALFAQAQTSDNNPKLSDGLKRFPQADANGDGVLTLEEARAFKGEADQPARKDGEDGGTAGAAVLELYEAREFEGVKYRLLKPIDLPENPGKKYASERCDETVDVWDWLFGQKRATE